MTQLTPFPVFRAWDNNGVPLAGGLLFSYIAGSTTKQATFTDSTGGTPNTNPVVLNYRGEAQVWLDPTKVYKLVLAPSTDTDPPTNPFWSVDQINGGSASPSFNIIPTVDNLFTLGSTTFSWANVYVGPNHAPILGASGNVGYYKRTPAEITLAVTPTDFSYPADPYVDPRRYGADPTGVADSTAAVQTAINVAYRCKGTVWIGNQCTFKCGALSLTFTGNHGNDGLKIMGSSVGGSVLQVNGTPATFITMTGNTPAGNPQESPLLIENLTINGTTASDGLLVQGMGLWTLRRVYILGFNRNLFLNSALTGLIDDCLLYQGNYGIYARQNGAGSGNNLVKIRDSAISLNARWGIDFGAGDRLKIESCDMEGNGTATAIQFTANVAGGATSGTLTSAFLLPTAQYPVKFNNNDVRWVTLTNGATTATWVTATTSISTPNATALTGAIALRSTLSFAASVATADLDGVWFENNAGMTLAQETVTGLTFAIRNCVWYADFGGNGLFVAGGSQFAMEDCSAATPGSTWIINNYTYSRLANVGAGTITDTSTYPTWIGVTTAAGNFPNGRPDAFTGTLTDCTTAPTASFNVLQQGGDIMLSLVTSLTALGTASTACTVTGLPAKYQPIASQNFPGMGVDNSAAKVMPIQINPASGTIVLNNTFTASATKGVPGGTVWRYRILT